MSLGDYVNRCVEHALGYLERFAPGPAGGLGFSDVEIYLWPQSWSDTTCGRGGVGGQAITTAHTVVIVGPSQDAVVYLGRPAYYLPAGADGDHREAFWRAIAGRQMPSVSSAGRIGCRRIEDGCTP
jgi:hypothetical protein